MPHSLKKALDKIGSGVEGLDSVLGGGLPSHRTYLVVGEPGSGKTTLALQFLLEGRKKGEECLYITLSESTEELKSAAASHGWSLDGIHIFELPIEDQLSADSQNTFFHTSEIELGATNEAILNEVKRTQPKRVVIDSMTELKLMAQSPSKFRRQILGFKQFFMNQGITVLLLDDKTMSSIHDQEVQSIVHGIMKLEQLSPEYGAERRRLSVTKLRGVSFRGGYHDFSIRQGGLVIFPRLIAAEHGTAQERSLLSSGIAGLDALIGGGIEMGSATLLIGPAGAGKSTLAMQYAAECAKKGEHAAVFTFDEGVRTVVGRSEGLGLPVGKYLSIGTLSIQQVDPAQLSPGEFANLVREAVDARKAKVIIIDSLNGYLQAMPEEKFLTLQMHELLTYLSQMGVATLLISVQHGLLGTDMQTSVDVSYLADNVFLLRYFEQHGSVKQAISVVKKRSGPHERSIREMSISSKGLQIGEPLTFLHGILTGTPTLHETAEKTK